jgi:hypothetical protein
VPNEVVREFRPIQIRGGCEQVLGRAPIGSIISPIDRRSQASLVLATLGKFLSQFKEILPFK